MGIKAHFKGNIDAAFNRFLAAIDEEIIDRLCRIGEEVVTLAKLIPPERGFTDRTGNLRSSIGYVVCKDGQPILTSAETEAGKLLEKHLADMVANIQDAFR